MYRVFLSSTSKDLVAYREAVHRAIDGLDDFDLVKMEDFGARDGPSREVCARKLQDCDVLVGLVGHYYGSSPPDEPTSYTELEYLEATDRGIARLMFVAPDDFPLPAGPIEPEDRKERQRSFRARVMEERVVVPFDDPHKLAALVVIALANWRWEQGEKTVSGTRRVPSFFVPFRKPDLIGREDSIKALHDALRHGHAAALTPTLVGQGGIGKTQLAVLYAYEKAGAYPGGVFWLDARQSPTDQFASIAHKMNLDGRGPSDIATALAWIGQIGSRPDALLIADNLEGSDLLTRELPNLPGTRLTAMGCKVLVTSRQRDLPDCEPIVVEFLGPNAARALLLREAVRDAASAGLEGAEEVHRLLGGLPLAIRLAGKILGRNPTLSLDTFASVLAEHGAIAVLDGRGRPLPDYQDGVKISLTALLAEGWNSLPADPAAAKDILRVLGCLPESAIIRVALLRELVKLPDDPLGLEDPCEAALELMYQRNLLERPDASHVRLHPLVREYVAKQAGHGFAEQLVMRAARNLRSAAFLGQQDTDGFLALMRELPILEALIDGRR